jgi:Uma2 family endonuclease
MEVRVQCSISLQGTAAPEPDIVWVVRGDYFERRPTEKEVLLLIEVADSSLAYDRGEKAGLYAAAGITDYWVVNLIERSIEVHRQPVNRYYRSVCGFTGNEEIRPLVLPGACLRPSELWPNG